MKNIQKISEEFIKKYDKKLQGGPKFILGKFFDYAQEHLKPVEGCGIPIQEFGGVPEGKMWLVMKDKVYQYEIPCHKDKGEEKIEKEIREELEKMGMTNINILDVEKRIYFATFDCKGDLISFRRDIKGFTKTGITLNEINKLGKYQIVFKEIPQTESQPKETKEIEELVYRNNKMENKESPTIFEITNKINEIIRKR